MRPDRSKFLMMLVACFASLSLCHAQEPETPPKKEEKQPPATEKPKSPKPLSDPTLLSPRLKKALQPAAETQAEAVHVKEVHAPKLPAIELKGLLLVTGEKPAAMIEVKSKGLMLVREGSQFSVIEPDGSSMTLIVKRISDQGVQIEAPTLKEIINLQ